MKIYDPYTNILRNHPIFYSTSVLKCSGSALPVAVEDMVLIMRSVSAQVVDYLRVGSLAASNF
jgi:hypothetical protein